MTSPKPLIYTTICILGHPIEDMIDGEKYSSEIIRV